MLLVNRVILPSSRNLCVSLQHPGFVTLSINSSTSAPPSVTYCQMPAPSDVALMMQAGPAAGRAVALLRGRAEELWERVAGCLPEAAQRNLALGTADLDAGDDEAAETWRARADGAWRLAAEAHALQLLSLGAFVQRRDAGGASLRRPGSARHGNRT